MDANDILFGNAAPAMGFDVGTKVRGRITSHTAIQRKEVEPNKATGTIEQGKPLFWTSNGKTTTEKTDRPVMDPVLTVQTAFTNFEGCSPQFKRIGADDGLRRIFVKGRSKANPGSIMDAVVAACREAGSKVNEGDFIELVCTGEGKKANRGMNAPKLYEATYWKADNPPAWASDLPGDKSADEDEAPVEDEDNPFN